MTVSSRPSSWDASTSRAAVELLRRPRYEVLALPGIAADVVGHLPRHSTVTVTVSARRGLEPTIALSEALAREGYRAVPHLAARMVRDRPQLAELVARLDEAGIEEVFVVGGDADPPIGEFTEAVQVLADVGAGRSVGVAAYPEGHPKIDEHELDRALLAKRDACSYAVTQMCFDAPAVGRWVRRVRGLGFDRPVHVGVPGVVDTLRLARIATRIGVGPSLRFALRQRGSGRLLRPGGYRPERLVLEMAREGATGLHIYTLGDVADTERWRRETMERLADA